MEKEFINDWKRALEFLKSAETNLKLKDIKTAANRGYFAAETSILACLKKKLKKFPKEHKNIWTYSKLLDLDIDSFSLLRELYDLRLQADYGRMSEIVELSEESVKDYLKKVEGLIDIIKKKYNFK